MGTVSNSFSTQKPTFPSGRVEIGYCNGYGNSSIRTIQIRNVYRSSYGQTYIRAYCELRQELRTFRLDRILWWESAGKYASNNVKPETEISPTPNAIPKSQQFSRQQKTEIKSSLTQPTNTSIPNKHQNIKKKKSRGIPGFWIICTLVACLFIFLKREDIGDIAVELFDIEFYDWDHEDYAVADFDFTPDPVEPTPSPKPKPNPKPAPQKDPAPQPKQEIQPEPQPKPAPVEEAYAMKIQQRIKRFKEITGIEHQGLIDWYVAADSNRNLELSWDEIQNFQNELVKCYTYKPNLTALNPVVFVAEGGGDCEDFALVTAGLIRFWDGLPYIAGFAPGPHAEGHAVCLVYSEVEPDSGTYYVIDEPAFVWSGENAPAGYYIPIDYEYVRSTSNAMGSGWYLQTLYGPEKMYGIWL